MRNEIERYRDATNGLIVYICLDTLDLFSIKTKILTQDLKFQFQVDQADAFLSFLAPSKHSWEQTSLGPTYKRIDIVRTELLR